MNNEDKYNKPFGTDFETDTGNSGSIQINCHCVLLRRSCSKDRSTALNLHH